MKRLLRAMGFRQIEGCTQRGKWLKGWIWLGPGAERAFKASFWTGAEVKAHTALT